jgi:hypothetical protein
MFITLLVLSVVAIIIGVAVFIERTIEGSDKEYCKKMKCRCPLKAKCKKKTKRKKK